MTRALLVCLGVVSAWSCAPDLRCETGFDGSKNCGSVVETGCAPGACIAFQPFQDAGVRNLLVDATKKGTREYIDLDADRELTVDEALGPANAWDLYFERFNIASNGGSSGSGGVKVAVLKDVSFDSVATAPSLTAFREDARFPVFNTEGDEWYFYDLTGHGLTARPYVYVVQTTAQRFFKVEVQDYYDEARTPARITMRYQPIAGPLP